MSNWFRTWLGNSDPQQRRSAGNIVKFLILLLVFTLIARGTSGATLARVDIETPIRSEIIDSISGIATVSTADTLDITAPSGLIITEMLIGAGQQIEPGDAIAVFNLNEVEERHARETASFERMALDLERLERGENIDASPVDSARRNLTRTQEDYQNTVRQGQEDISAARESLELLLSNDTAVYMLPVAMRNYQRALEDLYAVIEQSQTDIETAQDVEVDDTTLQNAIRNHERALEDYNTTIAQGVTDILTAQENIVTAQEDLDELLARHPRDMDRTAIDNAQRNLARARDDYNATVRQGEDNIRNAEIARDRALEVVVNISNAPFPNHDALEVAWAEYDLAEAALTTARNVAESNRLPAARRVEDAQTSLQQAQQGFDDSTQAEIERAEAEVERTETNLETVQNRANDNATTAARRLQDAETNLEQAQRNFDNSVTSAQNSFEATQNRANDNILAAERRLEDARNSMNLEIERAETNLQNTITRAEDARLNAARRVEDAQISLTTAQQNHERSIAQHTDTASQNLITASTLRLDLDAQQETIDALDKLLLNDGVLYANNYGVVSFATQQGVTTGTSPIVGVRDISGGFEAQLQISATDAERLRIGNEAEVTTGGGSMFFTPTTMGVVSAISQPDENDRVTITIALPGNNWTVGQRSDVQIVLHRANYDMSVPISALNSDNSGYFLYVMEERSTILGLQNVVTRVNVTIVASDSDMVSVRGPVTRDSLVIVGSNKAISAGNRVRIAD